MCDCDYKTCKIATNLFNVGNHENHKCGKKSGKAQSCRKKTSNKTSLSSQRGGCELMKAALPKQEAKR